MLRHESRVICRKGQNPHKVCSHEGALRPCPWCCLEYSSTLRPRPGALLEVRTLSCPASTCFNWGTLRCVPHQQVGAKAAKWHGLGGSQESGQSGYVRWNWRWIRGGEHAVLWLWLKMLLSAVTSTAYTDTCRQGGALPDVVLICIVCPPPAQPCC